MRETHRLFCGLRHITGSLALLSMVACTDATLESVPKPPPPPVDNLISIKGRFCTEKPETVEFPLKILFVVDVSQSMAVTDPPNPADSNYTGRTRAVVDVIRSLAGVPGVEIGIIAFAFGVNPLTRGFQRNLTEPEVLSLIGAAQNLSSSDSGTKYLDALDLAFQTIVTDVERADDLARARSRYSVIFVSDGRPEDLEPPDNSPATLLRVVEDLHQLEKERRLIELRLHTVFLSGHTPPQYQQVPADLLRDMAKHGAGTFRNIGNGEKINFLDIGFNSFRRVFTLKSLLVENRNARPIVARDLSTDSDGDGLSDEEERLIGTSETSTDTDGDGFGDQLEYGLRNAGLDPLDGSDADCKVAVGDDYNRRDDDGDGLLNCEERFLGSNPRLFDTDADGIPDPIEIRARVSAVWDDRLADPDRDGASNAFEIRDHTDPMLDDRKSFGKLRYVYDLREVEIRDSQSCFELTVDNIALVSSASPDGTLANKGWNEIKIVFGQSPADDPSDFGEFRVACVKARFLEEEELKIPASGIVELTEGDFKKPANLKDPADPEVFRAPRDCALPDRTER